MTTESDIKPAKRLRSLLIVISGLALAILLILAVRTPTRFQRDSDLIAAVQAGQVKRAITLLDAGANIEARYHIPNSVSQMATMRLDGLTPLALAIRRRDVSIIHVLLRRGANVNAKRDFRDGSPPQDIILSNAVETEQALIVKELLDRGAQVDSNIGMGETPLMLAASIGNLEIVQLLMQHGANVNAHDDRGFTALFMASGRHKRDHRPVIRVLRAAGAR